jgi:hypothetical protein
VAPLEVDEFAGAVLTRSPGLAARILFAVVNGATEVTPMALLAAMRGQARPEQTDRLALAESVLEGRATLAAGFEATGLLEEAAVRALSAFAQNPDDLMAIAAAAYLARAMGEIGAGDPVWLNQEALLRFATWQKAPGADGLRRAAQALRQAADLVTAREAEPFEKLYELWALLVEISDAAEDLETRRATLSVARMAMASAPESVRRLPSLLHSFSNAAWYLWVAEPDLALLLEAAAIEREAIAAARADDPFLPDLLTSLAVRTSAIWRETNDINVLAEGIAALRRAAELSRSEDAERLYGLSFGLGELWDATGNLEALRESVDIGRRATARPTAGPRGVDYRNHLSIRLSELGRSTRTTEPLIASVALARQLADDVRADAELYPGLVSNLASRLSELWQLTSDDALLAEALRQDRRALDVLPPGHPFGPKLLTNIAARLSERHATTGDDSDAQEALAAADKAAAAAKPGSPIHRIALDIRAAVLTQTWQFTGRRDAIDRAVAVSRSAVAEAPKGVDLPLLQHNLSTRLMYLWQATGDASLLDEAIELSRSALVGTQLSSPWRSSRLGHLSNVLSDRWLASRRDPALLFEALEHAQQAADLAAGTEAASALITPSRRLEDVWGLTHDASLLDAARDAAEAALALSKNPSLERVRCLSHLAGLLWRRWRDEYDAWALITRSVDLSREALTMAGQLGGDRPLIQGNLVIRLAALWRTTGLPELLDELAARVDTFTDTLATAEPTQSLVAVGGPRIVALTAGVALRLEASAETTLAAEWWSRVAAVGDRAVDAMEFYGRVAGRDHVERLTARLEIRRLFDGMAALVAHAHLQANPPDVAAALVALERGLAVSTLEFQTAVRLHRIRTNHPELRELVNRVEAVEAQLASAVVASETEPSPGPLPDPEPRRTERMRALRSEYEALVTQLEAATGTRLTFRRSFPDLIATVARVKRPVVWIAGVPTQLTMTDESRAGERALDVDDLPTIPGICLRVDPDASVRVGRLPELSYRRLEALSAAFEHTLTATRAATTARTAEEVLAKPSDSFATVTERLSSCFADARDLLPCDQEAIVIPAGLVASLPIHLVTGDEPVVHLAAALLDNPPSCPRIADAWLVVADPAGDLDGARAEGQRLAAEHPFVTLVREGDTRVDHLPWRQSFTVLHIAAHGTPEPMLVMHGDVEDDPAARAGGGHDGHLRPGDIAAHVSFFEQLEIFFMNCCFSGFSDTRWRDEAFGFAAVAAATGTRHVICARWAVSDAAAGRFAGAFYKRYAQGVDARRALASARSEIVADDPCTAHAYVLLGS